VAAQYLPAFSLSCPSSPCPASNPATTHEQERSEQLKYTTRSKVFALVPKKLHDASNKRQQKQHPQPEYTVDKHVNNCLINHLRHLDEPVEHMKCAVIDGVDVNLELIFSLAFLVQSRRARLVQLGHHFPKLLKLDSKYKAIELKSHSEY